MKITVYSTALLVIVGWLVIKIINGISAVNNSMDDILPLTFILSREDSSLIASSYRSKLQVAKVYHFKGNEPVSIINFDNKYKLITYKINLITKNSLSDVISSENESVDRSTGYVYSIIENEIPFRFQIKDPRGLPVSKIYVTLAGDSIKDVIKNDSIYSFHLLCDNFSIRYGPASPVDIFLIGQERGLGFTTVIPLDLMFLKRNNAIFLLVMTPMDLKSGIRPELLYNIVAGKPTD